jgi:RNA polymerase sigma factor (sigma-70 family)
MGDKHPEVEAQLRSVVQAEGGFVTALALKLAPAPGMAGDIAQQVFLEFLSKGKKWDLSGEVRPLLAGMTRNVARRFWREASRKMSPEMYGLAEHIRTLAEGEDVSWYSNEEKNALRRCLERLPEKSKRIVQTHYYLGVSSVEMANRMSMSAAAVRRALFRLRAQLRRCVNGVLGRESYV